MKSTCEFLIEKNSYFPVDILCKVNAKAKKKRYHFNVKQHQTVPATLSSHFEHSGAPVSCWTGISQEWYHINSPAGNNTQSLQEIPKNPPRKYLTISRSKGIQVTWPCLCPGHSLWIQ